MPKPCHVAAIALLAIIAQTADAQPRHSGQAHDVSARTPRMNPPGPRWGEKVRGQWVGGVYAPGGWAAYRPPVRGWVLPRYWVAPGFYVQDWPVYGLARPQPGYGWYRYYDDAVLADRDGRVVDVRGGIDWDARDDGFYRRDDRAGDRPPPPSPYGADYALPYDDVPVAPDDGYDDPAFAPDIVFAPMTEQVQPVGPPPPSRGTYVERHIGAAPVARSYTTTTTTTGPEGGYIANGYYYPPRTVTTVTVEHPSVVTTTTEEVVTYPARRAAPRRSARSKTLRR